MFRSKESEKLNNKSAFIVAGLVILVCLISLTGATYALFTSSPEDGTIGVISTSGIVDVDIVDSDNESFVGRVLQFKTTGAYEDGVYFEPGATFHTEGFYIVNKGNVPINFRVYISNDERLDMEKFEEAFEFYITTDPRGNEGAVNLLSFTGRLEAGESTEAYFLVIKMKENATSEFTGQVYDSIGITVCAVQGNIMTEGIDQNE